MLKSFTTILFLCLLMAAQAQTPIYTANFSGGIGSWTLVDNSGNNAGNWKYVHNPISAPSIGSLAFKSASFANGYALFLSDAATDDGKPEDADMISPVINCSAHSYVHMEFDEWFVQRGASSGTLLISTDGNSWAQAYTIDATQGTTTHTRVDLTPFVANQSTVYLKFNFVGDHDFFWAIDDIRIYSVPMLDVAVDTITINPYVLAGNNTITGTISNPGGVALNSVDISYAIDGGSPVYQSLSNLNIPPFGTYDFTFQQPASLTDFVKYQIEVATLGPNGGTDAVAANNSLSTSVNALSAMPSKNVVLEEFTTAQCQYCPMGATTVDVIDQAYSRVIPIGVHAGFGTDAMTTTDHSDLYAALGGGSGAPAVMIDRYYWPDQKEISLNMVSSADFSYTLWDEKTLQRLPVRSPLGIKATTYYNENTRSLTVVPTVEFYTQLSNLQYNVNCYIVEDSVSGTGSGYNQVNYYTNHSPGSFNPWYGKGSPIVGYKHRHVGRKMLGGVWGTSGIIPATVNSGDEFSTEYYFTLPASWNKDRVSLVVFVQENRTPTSMRSIINALELGLNETDSNTITTIISSIGNETNPTIGAINLYPNPAANSVTIDYTLTHPGTISFDVLNMLGETMHSGEQQKLNAGDYRTQVNTTTYPNGLYFVAVKSEGRVVSTLKFAVAR